MLDILIFIINVSKLSGTVGFFFRFDNIYDYFDIVKNILIRNLKIRIKILVL